jgi:hypothetical protein
VHEAEFRIEKVIVKDTLRPPGENQTRPSFAVHELDGAARFHDLEHRDEARLAWRFAEHILDELFLLDVALEPLKGNAGFVGLGLGMIDEDLGLLLDERQEIHASHLEGMIDPVIQVLIASEWQISLENDSVMATEDGYNRSSEFLCVAHN